MNRKGRRTVLLKGKRGSKYNNKKTEVDGIVFDSKAEASRWIELNYLLKTGVIKNLQRQVKFPLEVSCVEIGRPPVYVGAYYADFVYTYTETDEGVVEDVKGYKTALYRFKKKFVEAQYGIEILET